MTRYSQSENRKKSGVTLISLLLGLILIPINCYWVVKAEIIKATIHATILTMFFNVIFCMFVLTLLNHAIKRLFSRALSQAELLLIYTMLSVSTGLFGIDLMTLLVPLMGHAFWFATPENEWQELFWRYLPKWLTVSDQSILRGYYEGESSFWTAKHLAAWGGPILAWFAFIFVFMFVALCINVIIRKQWIQEERLSYPVIQLPFEMTDNKSGFFGNPIMWIGFAISGGFNLIQGLHFLYPIIPALNLKYDLAPLFTHRPLNAIKWLPINAYPFVVGLAYFMPLDLSFSFWFFYLFWKAQLVFRDIMGWGAMPGSRLTAQLSGAWLGIGLLAIINSRKHIMKFFSLALFNRRSSTPTPGALHNSVEPMGYRTAAFGLIFGMTLLVLFWHQAGMSLWVGIVFFSMYFIFVLAATRMRAELGPPAHELHTSGPDWILLDTFGSKAFTHGDLTSFSLLYWTTYGYRCHPMPHQLEGFKLADRAGINAKRMNYAILLATAVGIIAAFVVLFSLFYDYGGTSRVMGYSMGPSWTAYNRLQRQLYGVMGADYSITKQRIFGIAFTFFLMFMRRRFVWWRLHPVGYAVSAGWSVSWMWFSVFLSWLFKRSILRLGGLRAYRNTTPLFLGLILGQFVIGSLWTIISVVFDMQVQRFFP